MILGFGLVLKTVDAWMGLKGNQKEKDLSGAHVTQALTNCPRKPEQSECISPGAVMRFARLQPLQMAEVSWWYTSGGLGVSRTGDLQQE